MVERLARFLDAGVVLMSADGTAEVVAGRSPAGDLLAEISAAPPGLLELEAGGWHAVATPVVTRADQAARWLVLASPRRGFIGKLAKPAAEATAPLLAAMARLGDVVRELEQAVKAALLAEALAPQEARGPLPLAARATAASLHMHRTSLRYRLARAEQVLGRSLKQPSTIAAVYIALVAAAGNGGAPVGPSKAAL